jgi:serpin B
MTERELVAANTRFAFKLFNEIARQEGATNIFISPLSIALALAMTYNGAGGATARAMAETLELDGFSLDEVNRAYAELLATFESGVTGTSKDSDLVITLANALWGQPGIAFEPAFLQHSQSYYHAQVANLDFGTSGALDTINGWVSQQTRGKIDHIFDELSPLTILVLVNTVYFKGAWLRPFKESLTQGRAFHLPNSQQKQHPFMEQSEYLPYYRGDGFQAISLPYGRSQFSMDIFLPDEGSSLKDLLARLSAQSWALWTGRLNWTQGTLILPRFKTSYELDLNGTLKALGMGAAFDYLQADFTSMCQCDDPVYVSQVNHVTHVDVNETGTEAAAATGVAMALLGMAEDDAFTMLVDRPFLCAIRDTKTGNLLFLGSIVDPQ